MSKAGFTSECECSMRKRCERLIGETNSIWVCDEHSAHNRTLSINCRYFKGNSHTIRFDVDVHDSFFYVQRKRNKCYKRRRRKGKGKSEGGRKKMPTPLAEQHFLLWRWRGEKNAICSSCGEGGRKKREKKTIGVGAKRSTAIPSTLQLWKENGAGEKYLAALATINSSSEHSILIFSCD